MKNQTQNIPDQYKDSPFKSTALEASQMFDLNTSSKQPNSNSVPPHHQQKHNYFQNAKCPNGNPYHSICQSDKCQKQAIICADKKCTCIQQHKRFCSWIYPEAILQAISENMISTSGLIEKVNRIFDKLIDQISQQQVKAIQQLKSIGLEQGEKQFLGYLEREEFNHLNGKMVNQLIKKLDNGRDSLSQSHDEIIFEKIQHEWIKITESMKKGFSSLSKMLSTLDLKDEKPTSEMVVITNLKNQIESSILTTQEELQKLRNFFDEQRMTSLQLSMTGRKKIRLFQLLYRASNENFDTQRFWEKCHNVKNTITLIKTKMGKIIGGFTPLCWEKGKQNLYMVDDRRESFVFSITQNAKFTLKEEEKSKAILLHQQNHGPMFGIDLRLANRANKNPNSWANVGSCYINSKFKPNDTQSWQKFTGSVANTAFMTEEWEVYQIIY